VLFYSFTPFAFFSHGTTLTTREALLPGEQPGWAIHMRADEASFCESSWMVEMPYVDPSGVAAGEVLWGSSPLNHPQSLMQVGPHAKPRSHRDLSFNMAFLLEARKTPPTKSLLHSIRSTETYTFRIYSMLTD